MRDDEDNIRQYLPVLRRIIILVAVLTAIPVVMWTITTFVRNHIGPPRAPTLQPMALAPANPPTNTMAAADQSPAPSADTPQAAAPNASANAGTNVAAASAADTGGAAAPADATPTGATPSFKITSVAPSNAAPADATPAAAPSAASSFADDATASPAERAAPSQSPDDGAQVAARPQDSVGRPRRRRRPMRRPQPSRSLDWCHCRASVPRPLRWQATYRCLRLAPKRPAPAQPS